MAATFFRVDGADQETGEDTYLVLQAATKPQAEKLARQQGLLISSIRVARPDDWHAPARAAEPPAVPSTAEMDAFSQSAATPELDMFGEPPSFPPQAAPSSAPAVESNYRDDYPSGTAPFVEPAAARVEAPPRPVVEPSPTPAISGTAEAPTPAGGSSAAAVVLGCVGAALVIGGVLALALALWPDNAVRNELQQIDYRLHEVSQTILGGMLVLSGMMTFTLAIVCYLLPKRTLRP
ncbi:MAG TPA: hypothetical protein VGI81_13135 [Tepidisphaeraceae bacterium]